MDEKTRTEIAAFRYQLIAGVVNRATVLMPGEISSYFREQAEQFWEVPPDFRRHQFSIRTLERYKQQYEKGGLEALKPGIIPKRGTTAVDARVLLEAEKLRRERSDRSVEQIIFILEQCKVVEPGKLSQSTLSRYFRRQGLNRQQLLSERNKDYGYKRFEADSFGRLWQSDFHHTLYLPDPLNPKKRRLAKLCAILDDYSRFIVHGQYYWDERMPCLEDTLKKAIEKHGIPTQFYCDNGSAFSAGHISNVCSRLGIRLSHSVVRRPQGRGKIERFFQFVDSSFKPEAIKAIESGRIQKLEELNHAFQTWLQGYYHLRIHSSTKETPMTRMARFPANPLPYGKEELRRYFFVEESRKVDKAGCVSLHGAMYEVPAELARQTVQVRFDPFEPENAEVYLNGQLAGKAKLLDTTHNFHQKNLKHRLTELEKPEPMEGQMTFSMLEAAKASQQASLQDDVRYGLEGQV